MLRSIFRLAMVSAFAAGTSAVAQQAAPQGNAANRPALEQQLRERAAGLLQQRLHLTNTQMEQLEQSNRKFTPQLVQLAGRERDARRELRAQMQSPTPDQQRVNDLLNLSLSLQRQRLDVVEAEQKDLAAFMTPVQRAGYLAFQMQLRRRADQLMNQNGRRRGGAGAQRTPGPGNIR